MKFKFTIFLIVLITLSSLVFIQHLFARGQTCYCIDENDAEYVCNLYCDMGGEGGCMVATASGVGGECSNGNCWVTWSLRCEYNYNVRYTYWQCNYDCWWCEVIFL